MTQATDAPEPEVLTEVRGKAGVITLNRPKAMNALNQNMVDVLAQVLEQWRDDDQVSLVILAGAGERGLCAGGDVVSLYRDALANGTDGAKFWADEYALNLVISNYPKPYVAIMNGIVLGGGIGVSAHGSHRIVTDDTRVGMPETGIGFVPDVGGSHLLTHVPSHLGTHLALTGQHVGPGEAIECGLADVYVPQDQLATLVEQLCETGDAGLVQGFAQPAPTGFAAEHDDVEQVYSQETVEEILAALDELGQDWAADAAKRIRRNSPLALKVTLESLRRAKGQSLAEALDTEFRVSVNMQRGHEFVEGVRAQLVDKDRNPQWQPATLDEVGPDGVAAVFAPITDERITEPQLASRG
ncbi:MULTISPECIES: enoyl-CoA hydratase/isomerase family protein [unclassified Luteococcus]|uniref:enoyl-CoA hydratase/isomerase family protein n=1 Tax=unclassified Luteococcus TaxID=2639923 RepID=UPI00313DE119